MEFILTLFVIFIGITYIRRLEKKIDVAESKIFTMEQLLEMNLIKDGKKEKVKTRRAQKAKS
jgi:hypothetical protein